MLVFLREVEKGMKEKKVYLLGAFETIVNSNYETDLGDYVAQYKVSRASLFVDEMLPEKECLALVVKIFRKMDNKPVYANIFYKSLSYKDEVSNIFHSMSAESKINFILKKEGFNRIYMKNDSILPELSDFIEEFYVKNEDCFDYYKLGGNLPKDLLAQISKKFDSFQIGDKNENRRKR